MRRLAVLVLALCLGAGLLGCSDLAYLGRQLGGHLQLIRAARPVDDWLSDPATAQALRQRLETARAMREFSVTELHLPDNHSYRSYADLEREAAVWNVVATPALSLAPKTWCYPIMGCVAYHGDFERERAQDLGAQLKGQGWDVMVYPVPAYSSLGWTADPLLNTFIGYNDAALAGMIFHELAHQVAYAADDTGFNESFATAVERIGVRIWLERQATPALLEQYRETQRRQARFRTFTAGYRQRLLALYASDEPDKSAAKAHVFAAMREDYARLKAEEWGGYAGYDRWFVEANNASFALLASYNDQVPLFEALWQRQGGDWPRFYAAVKRIAALPKQERGEALTSATR
ncbi:MAG: aminopeptidase [Paucibacter sp.]|nr:aminopeptidase [Roseateles sp.]